MDDDTLVSAVKDDFHTADLEPAMTALLETCIQLNRRPWTVGPENVATLKEHGFSDEAIHDAYQVTAYFAYINRIADGLGVEMEPEMPPEPAGWVKDR